MSTVSRLRHNKEARQTGKQVNIKRQVDEAVKGKSTRERVQILLAAAKAIAATQDAQMSSAIERLEILKRDYGTK